MPEAVNLTPPAFLPTNPNAQKNLAAAEKAGIDLKNAVAAKAQLLDDLVTVYFGSIDNTVKALRNHLKVMEGMRANETADEFRLMYEAVSKAHNDAGQLLHSAYCDAL